MGGKKDIINSHSFVCNGMRSIEVKFACLCMEEERESIEPKHGGTIFFLVGSPRPRPNEENSGEKKVGLGGRFCMRERARDDMQNRSTQMDKKPYEMR